MKKMPPWINSGLKTSLPSVMKNSSDGKPGKRFFCEIKERKHYFFIILSI